MDPTSKEPDEVTQAALETVSEVVELADERKSVELRQRGLRTGPPIRSPMP